MAKKKNPTEKLEDLKVKYNNLHTRCVKRGKETELCQKHISDQDEMIKKGKAANERLLEEMKISRRNFRESNELVRNMETELHVKRVMLKDLESAVLLNFLRKNGIKYPYLGSELNK